MTGTVVEAALACGRSGAGRSGRGGAVPGGGRGGGLGTALFMLPVAG